MPLFFKNRTLLIGFVVLAFFFRIPVLWADSVGVSVSIVTPACNDSVDNDGDSLIDYPDDLGCSSATDNDESGSGTFQCNDGIDNDGDTRTDFPNDLGCDSALDDSESGETTQTTTGGGGSTQQTGPRADIAISGQSWPGSTISVRIAGIQVVTFGTASDGSFSFTIPAVTPGIYTIGLSAESSGGLRSNPFTVTVLVPPNVITSIDHVVFSPALAVDKTQVKAGDSITIYGKGPANQTLTVLVEGPDGTSVRKTVSTNSSGDFRLSLTTGSFPFGTYSAVAQLGNLFSAFKNFVVGDKNIEIKLEEACPTRGDLNADCRVDIVDFSIAAFWWGKPLSGTFAPREIKFLNGDGVVNIYDFSIMAYHWTG